MSDFIRVNITGPAIKACYLATGYRLDTASDEQLVVLSIFTTEGIYNYKMGTAIATKYIVRVQARSSSTASASRRGRPRVMEPGERIPHTHPSTNRSDVSPTTYPLQRDLSCT